MREDQVVDVPVHPDVFSGTDFRSTDLRLIGTRCGQCGELFFPRRFACPRCRCGKNMRDEAVPRVGEVYGLTYVARPSALYPEPYVLALIDLDNGPRILAQVKGPPEKVRIGVKVRVVLETLFETGTTSKRVWGYRFELVER